MQIRTSFVFDIGAARTRTLFLFDIGSDHSSASEESPAFAMTCNDVRKQRAKSDETEMRYAAGVAIRHSPFAFDRSIDRTTIA